MKKYLTLFCFLLFFCGTAAAQTDYYYSLGFGAGVANVYGDVATLKPKAIYTVGYYSHVNDFTTLSLELNLGNLAGGDRETDAYKREFLNKMVAVSFNADVQAGIFFRNDPPEKLNNLRNFFVGAGAGVLSNKLDYIQRTRSDGTAGEYSGKDKSTELVLPVRFGYEFRIPDREKAVRYRVAIAYQGNFTFAEGLDGYNELVVANRSKDMYTQIGITFKYGL